jgi:ArsR family metal-binding transcriptional regulator
MAKLIIFPDAESLEQALSVRPASGVHVEPLEAPSFCIGLAPPSLLVTGDIALFLSELHGKGVQLAGVIAYTPFKKELAQAPPPDSRWKDIIGGLRTISVRPSTSDPLKLRIDVVPLKPLGDLVPVMARMIRGGSYQPSKRILAFEEDQRLVVLASDSVTICRAESLFDAWIMLRTVVEFICTAWEARLNVEPDLRPRCGLGVNEIFRRLPGSNCGECGDVSCMEFALGIFTGQRILTDCSPLSEEVNRSGLESLRWVLGVIGLPQDAAQSSAERYDSSSRHGAIRREP